MGWTVLAAALTACVPPDASSPSDGGLGDAESGRDSGHTDATASDATSIDATKDAPSADTSTASDAAADGSVIDATADATPPDGGDAASDGATVDASPFDAGTDASDAAPDAASDAAPDAASDAGALYDAASPCDSDAGLLLCARFDQVVNVTDGWSSVYIANNYGLGSRDTSTSVSAPASFVATVPSSSQMSGGSYALIFDGQALNASVVLDMDLRLDDMPPGWGAYFASVSALPAG